MSAVRFRKSGQIIERKLESSHIVLPDGSDVRPLAEGEVVDLTMVPVIMLGGGRKWRHRLAEFLKQNRSFRGAFITPYYDSFGPTVRLIVTDAEVLSGESIASGQRPKEQWVNHRFLEDGRYVADHARMLGDRILAILNAEVEQDAPPEVLASHIAFGGRAGELRAQFRELEKRRVRLTHEEPRHIEGVIKEVLAAKLAAANITQLRDIPRDFLALEKIDPDLAAQAETVGTVVVPGLGRRLARSPSKSWGHPYLVIKLDEVAQISDWPFTRPEWLGERSVPVHLDIFVEGLDGDRWEGSHWTDPPLKVGATWDEIRAWIEKRVASSGE